MYKKCLSVFLALFTVSSLVHGVNYTPNETNPFDKTGTPEYSKWVSLKTFNTEPSYEVGGVTLTTGQYVDYLFYKIDPWKGLLFNLLLPGLGIGNSVIGDNNGAVITAIGSVSSGAVIVLGAVFEKHGAPEVGKGIQYTGIVCLAFFLIRSIISPFTYAERINGLLPKALATGNTAKLFDGFYVDIKDDGFYVKISDYVF